MFSVALLLAGLILPPDLHAHSAINRKAVLIRNDTPYRIYEYQLWMVGVGLIDATMPTPYTDRDGSPVFNPATGSLDPYRSDEAYIAEHECLVHAIAITEEGQLFTADLDVCDGPAIWIIDSSMHI